MPNSKFATISGRLIVFVTIIIVIVGAFSYANYARFHSRVTQLKRDGELQSLDDLTHVVENAEDDSLTYFKMAIESVKEFDIPLDESGRSQTDAEAIASFEAMQSKFPKYFENITQATNAPDMTSDPNSASEQHVNILDIHKIALTLEWKGSIHNAKDEHDDAAEVAIQLLQLAEKFDGITILQSMLANAFRTLACQIICEAVSLGDVDDELVSKIDQLLDEAQVMTSYTKALKAERSLSTYFMINSHLIEDENKNQQPIGIEWLTMQIPSGPAIVIGNSILDQMETGIKRSQTPLSVQYPKKEKSWSILDSFGGGLGPAYDRFRNSIGQKLATFRATRIILALELDDEATQRESWPQDYLMNLGVPKEMTTDPFTGKPMIVKNENGNWHVYSVGPDQSDDEESQTDNAGMKTEAASK